MKLYVGMMIQMSCLLAMEIELQEISKFSAQLRQVRLLKEKYETAQYLYACERDSDKAIELYEEVADNTLNPHLAAKANYRLGLLYGIGKYTSQNLQLAYCYFLLAGNFQCANLKVRACAQRRLGQLYLYGLGINASEDKAENMLKKAETQTTSVWAKTSAQWDLAQLYFMRAQQQQEEKEKYYKMGFEYLLLAKNQNGNKRIQLKAEAQYDQFIKSSGPMLIASLLTKILTTTRCELRKTIMYWELAQLYHEQLDMMANQTSLDAKNLKVKIKKCLWEIKTQRSHKEIKSKAQEMAKDLSFLLYETL